MNNHYAMTLLNQILEKWGSHQQLQLVLWNLEGAIKWVLYENPLGVFLSDGLPNMRIVSFTHPLKRKGKKKELFSSEKEFIACKNAVINLTVSRAAIVCSQYNGNRNLSTIWIFGSFSSFAVCSESMFLFAVPMNLGPEKKSRKQSTGKKLVACAYPKPCKMWALPSQSLCALILKSPDPLRL